MEDLTVRLGQWSWSEATPTPKLDVILHSARVYKEDKFLALRRSLLAQKPKIRHVMTGVENHVVI